MSDRHESYEVGDRPRLEVTNTSGRISVVPGATGTIEVMISGDGDRYVVEQIGDTVTVRPLRGSLRGMVSSDVTARVPPGTEVDAKNASGDVVIEVRASRLEVATASGDLRGGEVTGPARIKVASGNVQLDSVDGSLNIASASGDIRVGTVAADLTIQSASGDARVRCAEGRVTMNSASGELRLGRMEGSELNIRTLSGDVIVGIPARRTVELDMQSMSGELRNRLPEGDGSPPEATVRIVAKSVSGDLIMQGAE